MSLFSRLVERIVNEVNYNGVMRKQRSITSLFPTFYKRVDKVKASGGVNLLSQTPEVWSFSVASASGKGVYDVTLHFKNIPEMLTKFVPNVDLWNKDKTSVDYNLLGPEVLNMLDLEVDCSCPADLYWGPEYIKTQKQAQYGHQEQRPPNVRNPRQYGILCKHQEALFDKLPSYNFTFNGFLKKFWSKEIDRIVEDTKNRLKLVKPEAPKEEEKPEEVEKEEPMAKEEKPIPAEETPTAYGRGIKKVESPLAKYRRQKEEEKAVNV